MNRSGNLPFATYNPYLDNSSSLNQVNNSPGFGKRKFFKKRKRPNTLYNSGSFNNATQNEGDYDPSWEYSDHGGHSPRREYSPRNHDYDELRYSPPVSKRMNFESPEREIFYEREPSPEGRYSPSPPRDYGNSRDNFGGNKQVPRRFNGPKPKGSPNKINPWANGGPKPKWQNPGPKFGPGGPKFGPGTSKAGPSIYKQAKKVISQPMKKNPNYKGNKPNNNPNQVNKKVINHPHKIEVKEPLKNPPKYIPLNSPKNPQKSPAKNPAKNTKNPQKSPAKNTQNPQNPPKVPQNPPPAPILFLSSTAKETYSGPPHLRVIITSHGKQPFPSGIWLNLTKRSLIEAELLKALDLALKKPDEVQPLFDSMEFAFKLVKITCHNDESLAWLRKVLGAMSPPYVTRSIEEISKYSLVTLELPNGAYGDIIKRLNGQNRQIDLHHWILQGNKRKGGLLRFTYLINPAQHVLLMKAEKKVYYLFSAIPVNVFPFIVDQPINLWEDGYVQTSTVTSGSQEDKTSSEEKPKQAAVSSEPPAPVKVEEVTVKPPETPETLTTNAVKSEETPAQTEEVKSANPDSGDFLPLEIVESETVDLTKEVDENNAENTENDKASADDLPNQMDVCQSPFNVDGDEDIMAGFEILSDA